MITVRDHATGSLFDRWERLGPKRRRLLEGSWAPVFRNYLLQELPVAQIGAHFSDDMGRPSKDLTMVLGALVLQQLHDLTDAETSAAVGFNILWQYALDIQREEDAYVCERTLRSYRRKVIDGGLDQVMFRTLTDKLIASFGVDTSRQRLDSTAIRSAMRGLTRLGTLVETISRFLRELKRVHPDLVDRLSPTDWTRFVEGSGLGSFAQSVPSEAALRLPEAADDLYRLVTEFRPTAAAGLESFQMMERVLGEQCEIVRDDKGSPDRVRVKAPAEMPADNVVNPADPDTGYGGHKGLGYSVQLMESYSEEGAAERAGFQVITHVAVGKLNVHDQDALLPAIDDTQQRGVGPEMLLADGQYGSEACVKQAASRGVEVVSPLRKANGTKQQHLSLEDFEVNEAGHVVRCPAGHEPLVASGSGSSIRARFEPALCQECPLRARCPASRKARLLYTPERVRNRIRRLLEQGAAFRDRYRWRSGIEATMSRYKRQLNMAHLRVRGLKAVRYQAVLRALGLNILRASAWQLQMN